MSVAEKAAVADDTVKPWLIVVAMVVAMTVSSGALIHYAYGGFIKTVGSEFGWSRGTVSAGISLYMIGGAVSMPVFGALIDRWGPRFPSLISAVLFVIPMFFMPLVTGVWQFYFLFGVMGAVSGGVTVVPYSKAIAGAFGRKRGLAFGLGASGIGLGGVFLPFCSAFALETYGWRAGFVGLGVLVAALSIPAIWFGLAGFDRGTKQGPAQDASLSRLWRSRSLWLIGTAVALISLSVGGVVVHAIPLMTDRGMSLQIAAATVSAVAAASIAGRIGGGYLLDLFFAPRFVAVMFLVAAIGAGLIIGGGSGPFLLLGFICMGLVIGAEMDVMSYLVSRYCPLGDFGKAFGSMIFVFAVGGAAAIYLMGRCYDLFGSYDTGLTIAAGLAVLAAITVTQLGPYTQ